MQPVDATTVHDYTVWENIGYSLLLSSFIFVGLGYWLGFKVTAKCLVIGGSTGRPCLNNAKVVLGCHKHRRTKAVAWVRHLGAAKWLDPLLYRFHIVPPSFAPMPIPVVQSSSAAPPATPPTRPSTRMTLEARLAMWSLTFGIIQAGTGIIALVIAD